MKRKIKITSILLSLMFGCSFALTACGGDNSSSSSGGGQQGGVTDDIYTDGTHGGTVTDTTNYVLKDGKSDYKIVIPQNAGQMEEYAANEFQALFMEATGVRLPIITDASATKEGKVFSMGRTSLFASTNVQVNKQDLRADGFKIVTIDDDVYMCGAEGTGTLYAAYEYLYRELNFEQFYEDCYTLDKNVKNLTLKEYAIEERPDIGYRASSYGYIDGDSVVRYRMRYSGSKFAYFTAVGGQACHNSFEWLPPEEHYAAHPDWYSADQTQICYSARGNKESFNLMVNTALEKFKTIYAGVPDMKAISFSIQDFQTFCGCEACSASNAKYGTDSAVVIKFCNELSKKMEEYVTNLHKNDPNFVYDITLNFFAYFSTTSAPVTYDAATNTYAPIDNTVICGPHVAPWYAPIFMDYTYSIFHESNLTYLRNFYGWDAISETIHLWPYETCFKSYMSPYDSFNGMQDLFQVMADINTDFIFNQSQWNNGSATAWHMLKAYLTAKLAWDSSQDMDKLIDRYFAAMYGPAADTMREWFNSTRAYCAMLHSKGLYQGSFSVYYQATTADLWSYSILRKWLEYADKAMSEIEKFKDVDPELYASYYKHIAIERISPSYLIIQLYESRLNVSEAKMILDRTVEDSILCGATKTGEGSGTIANWAEDIDLTD